MNIDRLERVAALLDYLPAEKFDIRIFANDCGTVGCAVGHAAMQPEFRKEGLTFGSGHWGGETICYDGMVSWQAIEAFFELEDFEAEWLFLGDSYHREPAEITPAVVAGRIRNFIECCECGAQPITNNEEF